MTIAPLKPSNLKLTNSWDAKLMPNYPPLFPKLTTALVCKGRYERVLERDFGLKAHGMKYEIREAPRPICDRCDLDLFWR
jgi:hypothetical protein